MHNPINNNINHNQLKQSNLSYSLLLNDNIHHTTTTTPSPSPSPVIQGDHESSLQLWLNSSSLDHFYSSIYAYFYGRGAHSITLNRIVLFLKIGFFSILLTWLSVCIDLSQIKLINQPTPLSKVIHSNCFVTQIHPLIKPLLLFLAISWLYNFIQIRKTHLALLKIQQFYTHVLEISDDDIHSCDWALILSKLELLQLNHPHPSSASIGTINRLFITNRILRQDNYLIGLFSTPNVLNLNVPFPWIKNYLSPFLTVPIQWTIEQCVLGILFADPTLWTATRDQFRIGNSRRHGVAHMASNTGPAPQMNTVHLALASKLRSAFYSAALVSALLIPFIPLGMMAYFVLRYGNEYYRNPTPLSSRRFTPLAMWQTRELNEMQHEHELRLARALTPAHQYLSSFPATKTAILARLLLFILGSLASVLLGLSLLYPDTLIHLELGPDGRTPVFYLTVLGGLITLVRSLKALDTRSQPMDQELNAHFNTTTLDPLECMHRLVAETHVCPKIWAIWGFNSYRTRDQVALMVMPKLKLYALELVGVLVAPFVLGFSVASKADVIVQFIMDHTIVMPGLGCVYEGAIFDERVFAQQSDSRLPVDANLNETVMLDLSDNDTDDRDCHVSARNRDSSVKTKMTLSAIQFQQNHPSWQPPRLLASYLNNLAQAHLNQYPSTSATSHQNPVTANPGHLFTPPHRPFSSSTTPAPILPVSIYESILQTPGIFPPPTSRQRSPDDYVSPTDSLSSSSTGPSSSVSEIRPSIPPTLSLFARQSSSDTKTTTNGLPALVDMDTHPLGDEIPLLDVGLYANNTTVAVSTCTTTTTSVPAGGSGPDPATDAGNRSTCSTTPEHVGRVDNLGSTSVATDAMLQMVHEFYGND